MKQLSVSKIVLLLLLVTLVWVNFNISNWKHPDKVIAWDVKSYYAYLPAAFIYKDLTLLFREQKPEYIDWFWPRKAPNGSLVIYTTMGMSILYSPFFFLAHCYTLLTTPEEANGYTINYSFMLVMSTIFYVFIGLFYMRKLLLKYFEDKTVAFALVGIFLGTNLFCYATTESVISHAYSYSLISVFLFYTDCWYRNPSVRDSIFIGVLAGLISLIRPTNIVVVLLFIFWSWSGLKEFSERFRLFIRHTGKILIIVLSAFLIWLPQLIYWKCLTGQWLYFSYGSSASFFFGNPQIFNVLFSFRNGLFIYTPLMLAAVIGIPFLISSYRKFLIPVLLYFVISLYIISSWWCWWYGGAFGARSFVDSYAVYAIPLSAIFQKTLSGKRLVKIGLFTLYGTLIIINLFFTYKYRYGSIHYDSMTREALFDSFWRLRPRATFYDKLEIPDYIKAEKGIYEIEQK